uniref:Uncharacterized protein n=1 Tax=Arundo donax TaxID=35708 RepID=A0A0A9GH60_ARUDO
MFFIILQAPSEPAVQCIKMPLSVRLKMTHDMVEAFCLVVLVIWFPF